ncbi:unnamed protein product [Lupinus luteus]|uniref:Uncharacterized protein n=1 Tax=Lupinus luteus TaxID=3873 RepID=A0AAV1YAG9_LUPLU
MIVTPRAIHHTLGKGKTPSLSQPLVGYDVPQAVKINLMIDEAIQEHHVVELQKVKEAHEAQDEVASLWVHFEEAKDEIRLLSDKLKLSNEQGQVSKVNLHPLEKLDASRKNMKSRNKLHVIYGSDHSIKIAKKHLQANGSTQDAADVVAQQAIAAFISKSLE